MEKLVAKIVNNLELKPFELTLLRKKLLTEDFKFVITLLDLSTKNNYWALRVLSLAPKYFKNANPENLEKFKSLLSEFQQQGNNYIYQKAFHSMASQILLTSIIPNNLKTIYFTQNIQSLDTDRLADDFVDHTVKFIYDQNYPNLPAGALQIVYQALKRRKIFNVLELNQLLLIHLNYNLKTPGLSEDNEFLVKNINLSPHLPKFDSFLLHKSLESWHDLINKSQMKYDINQHHQTKKRLDRLNQEYQDMRLKFREILGQKDDALSQLDKFLLG
jgi:hypothetical protein